MVRILAFSGSARSASLNRRLLAAATRDVRDAGGEVTEIDLRELDMPIYDGDLEERSGLPTGARRLKELLADHPGLLIACPEYNSGVTPLLKNAIDWASRPEGDEKPAQLFRGKVAGLCGASPSDLGALRAMTMLRGILANIAVHVVPRMPRLPGAGDDDFAADGSLSDDKHAAQLRGMAEELVRTVRVFTAGG